MPPVFLPFDHGILMTHPASNLNLVSESSFLPLLAADMSMDADQLNDIIQQLPPVGMVAMIVGLGVGLVLWLLGRRLLRAGVVISGLILGGLAGLLLGESLADEGAYVLPMVIGGGISGALLAWLLFRVWMALSGAVIVALVVPAIMIVWQGVPTPELPTTTDFRDRLQLQMEGPPSLGETFEIDQPQEEQASQGRIMTFFNDIMAVLRQLYINEVEDIQNWWDQQPTTTRNTLMAAAGIGAIIGLLLGLLLPNISAAGQSSLAGALLIVFTGRALLSHFATDQMQWLYNARPLIITIGLITVLGVLLQCTWLSRKADK